MIKVIGIDVTRPVFEIYGIDEQGNVAVNQKIKQSEMPAYFKNLRRCRVGIAVDDAYMPLARHWGKKLESYNHQATLMAFAFVESFAKEHDFDGVNAESICKAAAQL